MSKETGIIALGLWVFILPFLGIPGSWRTVLLVVTGMGLAVFGFMLRTEALSDTPRQPSPRNPFMDSVHAPAQSAASQSHDPVRSPQYPKKELAE